MYKNISNLATNTKLNQLRILDNILSYYYTPIGKEYAAMINIEIVWYVMMTDQTYIIENLIDFDYK